MLKHFLTPVIVAGVPRSGTSLLTGLAVMHGAWAGECRPADSRNPAGYFENEKIKHILDTGGDCSGVEKEALAQGYDGGVWVYKCPIRQLPELKQRGFQPTVIFARRNFSSVLASQKAYPGYKEGLTDRGLERLLNAALIVMSEAEKMYTAIYEIDFEDILGGEYRRLGEAFSVAGLKFDRSVADSFVEQKLNHFGGRAG